MNRISIFLLFVSLLASACSKKQEPTPDLTANFLGKWRSGSYTGDSIIYWRAWNITKVSNNEVKITSVSTVNSSVYFAVTKDYVDVAERVKLLDENTLELKITMNDNKGEHTVIGTATIKDRRMLIDARVTSKQTGAVEIRIEEFDTSG